MLAETILDGVRFIHLAGLALGFGLCLYLESRLARHLRTPITGATIRAVERIHRYVAVALIVLWSSGVVLLAMRTGFDPAATTPKLIAKLVVVLVLTANAVAIGVVALPTMRRLVGRSAIQAPLVDRLTMAGVAAISACSWLAALSLGVFSILKTLDLATLAALGGVLYLTGLAVGLLAAAAAPALFGARDAFARGRAIGAVPSPA